MGDEWPIYSSDNGCKPFFIGPVEAALAQAGAVDNKRVLITGCGSRSMIGERMVQQGAQVSAVDISFDDIKLATLRRGGVDYLQADAVRLPFREEQFDISLSVSTLQYMEIGSALKECSRVMKKSGVSIFIENLESCPVARVYRAWRRFSGTKEPENMVIRRHMLLQDLSIFREHYSRVTVSVWHDWTTLLYPFVHGEMPHHRAARFLAQAGGRPVSSESRRARLGWIAQIVAVR